MGCPLPTLNGLSHQDIKPAGQIVEEMVQQAFEQLQTVPWTEMFHTHGGFLKWWYPDNHGFS